MTELQIPEVKTSSIERRSSNLQLQSDISTLLSR